MPMQPFTSNFADNSTEAGFQFTFFCDLCREGYKSSFIESKTYKKGKFFSGLGKAISFGASIVGAGNIGYNVERGADIISERFHGMSPEWHNEHDGAFELSQNEAKTHFFRCPRCKKYVCENDWNEQEGLCVEDAPRQNIEVAAAKAEKMVQDIHEKAQHTTVFTGAIESKQTLCPRCSKPVGEGKFCNNCGAPLGLNICPKCGAKNNAASRFCGECGTPMA
jgi:hypothetical protein